MIMSGTMFMFNVVETCWTGLSMVKNRPLSYILYHQSNFMKRYVILRKATKLPKGLQLLRAYHARTSQESLSLMFT